MDQEDTLVTTSPVNNIDAINLNLVINTSPSEKELNNELNYIIITPPDNENRIEFPTFDR